MGEIGIYELFRFLIRVFFSFLKAPDFDMIDFIYVHIFFEDQCLIILVIPARYDLYKISERN